MILLVLLNLLLCGATVSADTLNDGDLKKIGFDQKLGAAVSPDLSFRDESGAAVSIGSYLGRRPVILVLGYYECPMLCSMVLNGMINALQDVKMEMGRDYEVVNVSIDPHETSALAAAKKKSYVKRFGQPGAAEGWHFLTGDEAAIRKLAGEVGFNYRYDSSIKQYAHPSGLVILSPSGKVSHYLFGVDFSAADLSKSLADASQARVGSPIAQLFLLCFHYSPITGKYSGIVLGVVRIVAVAMVTILAAIVTGPLWKRHRLAKEKGI